MRIDRIYAVAVTAAHEFNNELTVILNSVSESLNYLEDDHPARDLLLDLQSAAQRCIWNSSHLLEFGARPRLRRTSPSKYAADD